jgi:hypothetical protein
VADAANTWVEISPLGACLFCACLHCQTVLCGEGTSQMQT